MASSEKRFAKYVPELEKQSAQSKRRARLEREAGKLDRRSAVQLAYSLLSGVLSDGVDYGDFQSAQAAGRDIKKAARLIEWI